MNIPSTCTIREEIGDRIPVNDLIYLEVGVYPTKEREYDWSKLIILKLNTQEKIQNWLNKLIKLEHHYTFHSAESLIAYTKDDVYIFAQDDPGYSFIQAPRNPPEITQ
jgi:hypothetical protein